MSQRPMQNPYDDGTDPLDREALLAQMNGGGGMSTGGSHYAEQRDAAQQAPAQEVAGGGSSAATTPFKSYTPPAAGADLSSGFLENNRSHVGAASEALSGMATGASMGSVVPGIGTAVGAGIGAAYGGIKGFIANRSNDTKNDREAFAKGMGVNDSTALWAKLGTDVPPEVAQELQNRALNRIGKHDNGANEQWMQDVQAALAAGKPAAAPGVPPPATTNAPGAGVPGAPGEVAPAAPVDSSGWDMDGYPKPGYVPTSIGAAPRGRNPEKWNDPNHQSPKYVVSRILAEQGSPSIEQITRALPNLQKAYPGTTFDGKDKLTIPGVGTVDVLTAASSTDPNKEHFNSWGAILDKDGNPSKHARNAQGAQGVAGGGGMPAGADSLVSSDPEFFKRLMSQLQGSLSGPSTVDDSALRQLL